MATFEITWKAPEFEYREKGVSWYWISIIVMTLVLGVAVWQRNFLFGFFVVIAEILILIWANKKPDTATFKLTDKGLEIVDRKMYTYAELAAFSVDEHAQGKLVEIKLRFHRKLRPPLKIGVPKNQKDDVEKALSAFLEQVDHGDSFLDDLEKFVRF